MKHCNNNASFLYTKFKYHFKIVFFNLIRILYANISIHIKITLSVFIIKDRYPMIYKFQLLCKTSSNVNKSFKWNSWRFHGSVQVGSGHNSSLWLRYLDIGQKIKHWLETNKLLILHQLMQATWYISIYNIT